MNELKIFNQHYSKAKTAVLPTTLITALKKDIISALGDEKIEKEKMLIKEIEKGLKSIGYDPTQKIYKISDGRFKYNTSKKFGLTQGIYRTYREAVESVYDKLVNIPTIEYCFLKARENHIYRTIGTQNRHWNFWCLIKDYDFVKREITSIKRSQVKAFLEKVANEKHLNDKVIKGVITNLNMAFSYANDELDLQCINLSRLQFDFTPYKNFRHNELLKKDNPVAARPYNYDEMQTLLVYAWKSIETPSAVYERAFSFMSRVNLRIGELKALRWTDVDWKNKTIFIQDEIHYEEENGKRIHKAAGHLKAYEEPRTQALSDQAYEILKIQRDINPDGEFIFMINGEVLKTNSFNGCLRRLCKETGVVYRSSHKIRFYHNSIMRDNKIDSDAIRRSNGHTSQQMTEYYDRRELEYKAPISSEIMTKMVDIPCVS